MSERTKQVAERIRGAVVPLNTCFNEDGSVDFPSVVRYVDWMCDSGVPVISMATGSSEFTSLSDEDVWQLTAEVAGVTAGRAVYIAGTGRWKASKCGEFLAHADSVGADAVRVQVDAAIRDLPDVYIGYFDMIEGASDIPLVLEDGAPPVSMGAELAKRSNVAGAMIHDMEAYLDLTIATADEVFSTICAGRMRYMIYAYQVGSPAFQCGIAPFRPDIAIEFYEHLESGRYDEAWQMVFRYEDPWFEGALQVDWLHAIKGAIHLRGLYPSARKCPPWPDASPETIDTIRKVLEDVFGPIEKVAL
jgi:4-hydroxy-tetrahydrodipicolinate synthase